MNLPILILRDTTERPELVESGGGILVGTVQEVIVREVKRLLHNPETHQSMQSAQNPFGDGFAATRIHTILTRSDDAIYPS